MAILPTTWHLAPGASTHFLNVLCPAAPSFPWAAFTGVLKEQLQLCTIETVVLTNPGQHL